MVGAKTFTDGATPPTPGTTVNGLAGSGDVGGAARNDRLEELGRLEEVREVEGVEPVKVGKEAVRGDVEDIVRGEQL